MTLHEMPCRLMNERFWSKEEYVLSTGLPREAFGLDGSSSDARMISLGSESGELSASVGW